MLLPILFFCEWLIYLRTNLKFQAIEMRSSSVSFGKTKCSKVEGNTSIDPTSGRIFTLGAKDWPPIWLKI